MRRQPASVAFFLTSLSGKSLSTAATQYRNPKARISAGSNRNWTIGSAGLS